MIDSLYKVLVVDDDRTIREVCAEALSYDGCEVTVAPCGWDALGLLNGREWDLVVSDVNMPGLDGIDFYRVAVSRAPELASKFIFMTGDQTSARTIEAMGVRLVRKPFKVKDLLDEASSVFKSIDANRRHKRLPVARCMQVRISCAGVDAVAEDLSLNGMKIRYAGAPFEKGPVLKISIDALNLSTEARVVWSSASASESYSGVIFEKPVPVSVLADLASNRF